MIKSTQRPPIVLADQLACDSGYSRGHILRGRDALRQQWRRLSPRGTWLISEEQADNIIVWLRSDHWSKAKLLDGCLWCGTALVPMHALGLCRRDYVLYRKKCQELSIPARPRDQIGMVMIVGGPIQMIERIERGIALSRANLDEISPGSMGNEK